MCSAGEGTFGHECYSLSSWVTENPDFIFQLILHRGSTWIQVRVFASAVLAGVFLLALKGDRVGMDR